MLNKIKKINLLECFILLMPFIDVLNTLFDLSLSLIIRGLFLIGLLIYFIFINKSKYKKISFGLYGILGAFFVIYLFHYFTLNGTNNIVKEFITLIKFLYLPVVSIALLNYYTDKEMKLSKIMQNLAWIYCALIILPTVFNISLNSYSYGKLGTSGLFYSPNELSSILAVLSPFVIMNIFVEKKKILNILLAIIFIITCYLIGTKTPVLGLLASLTAAVLLNLLNAIINKKNAINLLISIILLALSVFYYPNSYLYSNINYQGNDYNESTTPINPEIPNVDDNTVIIKNELHDNDLYINFPTKLYQNTISDSKILNLIFSSRNIYLQENLNKFANTILSKQVFGLTLGLSDDGVTSTQMSEMDLFDILIYYGIAGAVILIGYLVIILILSIIKYFKNFKKNLSDFELNATMVSYGLTMLIAFTAGHTLSAPTVSLLISLVLCFLINKFKILEKIKKIPIKALLVVIMSYIVLALIIIFACYNKNEVIELSIKNNELSSNNEIIKIEEQNIEYNQIKDNLKYYTIESYKNIQIIYVIREFEDNSTIEFITLNNNEDIKVQFDIDILRNIDKSSIEKNYILIDSEENTLISDTYHYNTHTKSIKGFNKYSYKNLLNESSDYLIEDDIINKKITLNPNESADTYIITSKKSFNNIDELPWISFNGCYEPIFDNVYVKSYNIPKANSSILKYIFTNNFLININKYSNYNKEIWYSDYYVIPYTSISKNNLYISSSLNYIINKNLEELNTSIKPYRSFASLIKELYNSDKYLKTDNGIIINYAFDSSFIEQVNIINILLKDYLVNDEIDSKEIALKILSEIESKNWISDNNGIYEYIDENYYYQGNITNPYIVNSLLELQNNLEECEESTQKIENYIKYFQNTFKNIDRK